METTNINTGVNSLLDAISTKLETRKPRGAWNNAVNVYALELIEVARGYDRQPINAHDLNRMMLNGASDWKQFSWGGSSLIYDQDIAERVCSASELKRVTNKNGLRDMATPREHWLDVQARALYQAAMLVTVIYNGIVNA